ncbi:MAG: YihY family inner membrane protein [Burkholderiaceae bacterium]|jgi:membrane protein
MKKILSSARRLVAERSLRWRAFGKLMAHRAGEQQLPQVAASLTFTSVLALVPLATVALAIFTAFPMFQRFRSALEGYLFDSFFPESLSETILEYVNQFSSKASGLTTIGILALILTALMTMLTVDKVFNRIWHVRRKRPLFRKLVVYWSMLTLAPMFLGIGLSLSSALVAQSISLVASFPTSHSLGRSLVAIVPFLCSVVAFSIAYVMIPNRPVRWQDALAGGLLAAFLFEIGKRAFTYYIVHFPAYTALYGALAALPLFLLWIYLSWMIVLLGATVTASLPSARLGRWDERAPPGERWMLGLAVLQSLVQAGRAARFGTTMDELRAHFKAAPDVLDDVLERLEGLGLVGRLVSERQIERFALICNLSYVPAETLARAFWFDRGALTHWTALLPVAGRNMNALADAYLANSTIADWLGLCDAKLTNKEVSLVPASSDDR